MSTLDALHRAVIADPADRTVRLAYADALDESGDPASAARAEYIRGQIAAEAGAPDAPPPMRLEELFERHWLDWWRPVCAAAGLPVPRTRRRIVRGVAGPYSAAGDTVRMVDYGVQVRFAGGFPEEVRLLTHNHPAQLTDLTHRWGDAIPLARLAFGGHLPPQEWAGVDGPHLARLPDLSFDRISGETAAEVAASPHLASLARLAVTAADGVRSLVGDPPWAGLRSLRLTGHLPPPAVHTLADACTLSGLEDVSVTLGNPIDFSGTVGHMLARAIRTLFTQGTAPPPGADTRWSHFGPALEELAAAPWVRRLRRLRVEAGAAGLFGALTERLSGRQAADDFLPDAAVRALADAADAGKLDSLVLPAGVVRDPVREELAARPGGRVSFA
jgi:uncharacterized protein (TIGR02996 family)